MNAAGRLAAFGAGLVVAFAGAYIAAAGLVPEAAVATWKESSTMTDHTALAQNPAPAAQNRTSMQGLSLDQYGYELAPVQAPPTASAAGVLSFTILKPDGSPLIDYATKHDKDLHLIVVRTDGTGFQHTHPTLDRTTGVWSTPWTWPAAGTYRVFADFAPADVENAPALTLTRNVQVSGEFTPVVLTTSRTRDQVAGYTVSLDGQLVAGTTTTLTATVSKNGEAVSTLEPYLGAFGHLVALRDGDLAYLHVHPEGPEPAAGQNGGPSIEFAAEAPTAGRYLLYLDFQVEGRVHTATFVVDAERGNAASVPAADTDSPHSNGHTDGH